MKTNSRVLIYAIYAVAIAFIAIFMGCGNKSTNTITEDKIEVVVSPHIKPVFSVERISKEEYMLAESTSADYNIYPQRIDSIVHSEIINKVFQDARERITRVDSLRRCAIYEAMTDEELYCVNNLLYLPEWNMLGIRIPLDYHNDTLWWYDSNNGESIIGTLFSPTSINTNGIYVCQSLGDCDITLDLHFFEKQGNRIYELQAYKNNNFSGEHCLFVPEGENYKPIFWQEDNILYLRSYDIVKNEDIYLKISLK
ncbi:hypothetical protein IMSAGC008_01201 [Muribaculaceae bacterium]|nr:hypothetical protein IMSAGC008_01201 [Muribaculaceae bacterium]